MDDNISNIIPTLYAEMESDGGNESKALLGYYMECNTQEKAVVNNVLIYICGWSFETLLDKCSIKMNQEGEPIIE